MSQKIAVIGGGAMGGALAIGLHKIEDVRVVVADPSEEAALRLAPITVTKNNKEAANDAAVTFVVVKPWLVEKVLTDLAANIGANASERLNSGIGANASERLNSGHLVVIAAGVPLENIRRWAGNHWQTISLAIPNLAIAQHQSVTFLCHDSDYKRSEALAPKEAVAPKELFEQMGIVVETDEKHLAAGTTLASCGLAYAMRYIRAASEGGVELGFKADEAKAIVMQTVKGAVGMLEATGLHPEAAIDLVTTPGGVTIRGLNEMEHAGFTSSVIRGLKAGLGR